jgi:hypothetical protein
MARISAKAPSRSSLEVTTGTPWLSGSERAEDVASHADRRRDEDERTRQLLKRAGDRSERQPGEEVTARRQQQCAEACSYARRVGAQQRSESRRDRATAAARLPKGRERPAPDRASELSADDVKPHNSTRVGCAVTA